MGAGGGRSATDTDGVAREIRELGLERNVAELDTIGLTVLEPGQAAPPSFFDRVRDATLQVCKARTGVDHDIDQGPAEPLIVDHGTADELTLREPAAQYVLPYLLFDDPVYEELVQNRTVLALMRHLLGRDVRLSSLDSIVKWSGEGYGPGLGLHHDSLTIRAPLTASDPFVSNSNWLLTDYTLEGGAFCFVPGSHRRPRTPGPGEGVDDAVPVEAPAGSVIVFHGCVWHGAFPKKTPGLRLSVHAYYARPFVRTQEAFTNNAPAEVLDRNPDSFRTMLGYDDPFGWTADGPPYLPKPRRVSDG